MNGRDGVEENSKLARTTRIPVKLSGHMKSMAPHRHKRLKDLHMEILASFIAEKPWKDGEVPFRETKSLASGASPDGRSGWMQVNFDFTNHPDIFKAVDRVAADEGVSVSSVLYTACYWWSWYVAPPAQEVERRKQLGVPPWIELSEEAKAAVARAELASEKAKAAADRQKG